MLYVTTRNKLDAYTVPKMLSGNRGPDGGLYQPFRLPVLSPEAVAELAKKSFSQCVAEVLNLYFPCELTSWDVEFCVGRYPVKVAVLGSRILVGETWHNLKGSYAHLEQELAKKICSENKDQTPSWVGIAIRIAVLCGLFGELIRSGFADAEHPLDVAVPTGDFGVAMTLWHGREMGLPIGNIICGCNENSAIWDLVHLGEMNTGAVAVQTTTPACDYTVPEQLERLIYNTLGCDEVLRFCDIWRKGGIYALHKEDLQKLRKGIYAGVTSRERVSSVMNSVERTAGYILGPYEALAYSSLMDYRARTGESRTALILAERSPEQDASLVCQALGISPRELAQKLNR